MKKSLTVAAILFFGITFIHSNASADIDGALSAIEKQLDEIEKTKKITDGVDFDKTLDDYFRQLQKAHETTLQSIEKEATSAERDPQTGKAFSTKMFGKKLDSWEKNLTNHRARMEKVVSRLMKINVKVREGKIMIPLEIIKKFPPEEIKELEEWLTPDTREKYKKLDKELFKASMTPDLLYRGIVDFLVPDAEAALAVGCVATCIYGTPAGCAGCVAMALGTGAYLTTKLNEALNNCNRYWWSWRRRLCKAATIASYLTLIS